MSAVKSVFLVFFCDKLRCRGNLVMRFLSILSIHVFQQWKYWRDAMETQQWVLFSVELKTVRNVYTAGPSGRTV